MQIADSFEYQDCDCVCLFSGGLDSFCGAIRTIRRRDLLAWLDIMNIPKLAKTEFICQDFSGSLSEQSVKFISFTANSRAPISEKEGILKGSENTSSWQVITVFMCST